MVTSAASWPSCETVRVSPTWPTLRLGGGGAGVPVPGGGGGGSETVGNWPEVPWLEVPVLEVPMLMRTPAATVRATSPAATPPTIQGHLRRFRCGGWPETPGGGGQDGPPGPDGGCSAGRFQIGRFSDTGASPSLPGR